MKKILSRSLFISASLIVLAALTASCKKDGAPATCSLTVQLQADGRDFAVSGIDIVASDGTNSFTVPSDGKGQAVFSLPPANYSLEASCVSGSGADKYAYNGRGVLTLSGTGQKYTLGMVKSTISPIVIKELYCGGCMNDDASKSYTDDAYFTIYNNSDKESDVSDLVFGLLGPANAQGDDQYLVDGVLKYENAGWIPAYSALWWFNSTVKIPAYSQITVACFGAIDHSKTVSASVDLSKESYYWMSNKDITDIYDNGKYQVTEKLSTSNYLSCKPFSQSNAWVLSVSSPAVFIARMSKADALALSTDTQGYDTTLGSYAVCVKFPSAKVIDAVESWSLADMDESVIRFPACINSGHVDFTNFTGRTLYRNVDKTATEAVAGNEGKLIYGYAEDPCGINAEASIKNGAKIIYLNTNNSTRDFHERKTPALK